MRARGWSRSSGVMSGISLPTVGVGRADSPMPAGIARVRSMRPLRQTAVPLTAAVLAAAVGLAAADAVRTERAAPAPSRSSFGHYQPTAPPRYDGWVRSSRYVAARDGTRLAMDLFRPTRAGVVADEPLPVVWTMT